MHWQLVTLAVILLGFAAISRRIEGTRITAPMLFTAAGLVVGVDALGLIDPEAEGLEVGVVAEATLAVVLFSDASRIDITALRKTLHIPARLLGIGLPLTILAGFGVALLLLGDLAWPEALLIAIILAPTDAALGQVVVTSKRLPVRIRQSLNVEAGLNDGICVPLFLIALAVALAEEDAIGHGHAAQLVFEKIGYGVLDRRSRRGRLLLPSSSTARRAGSSTTRGSRSSRSRERSSRSRWPRRSGDPASSPPSSAAPRSAGCAGIAEARSRISSSRRGRSSQP